MPAPNNPAFSNKLLCVGLKKSAIVMHALALKLEDAAAKAETLALVTIISEAAKRFED